MSPENETPLAPKDWAYTSAIVLPDYTKVRRYIGAIQWLTGPNVPLVDEPRVRAGLVELRPKGGKEIFHFRIFWHGEEMDSFTQVEIDAAILKAFTTLCVNRKVQMAFGDVFAKALIDPAQTKKIISTFEQAFIGLDNAIRKD